jgi:hypothetical protein
MLIMHGDTRGRLVLAASALLCGYLEGSAESGGRDGQLQLVPRVSMVPRHALQQCAAAVVLPGPHLQQARTPAQHITHANRWGCM